MSIIQRIRDKAAWFIFGAIAISLIAFILQDAFSGRGGGGWFGGNSTTILSVNGEQVDQKDYSDKIKDVENYYQQQGMTLNDAQRNQIQNQTFKDMISEKILEQQAEKAGVTITDKEFNDMLFGDNPPQFIQQLGMGQNGQGFSMEQAKAQFNNIKKVYNDKNKRAQVIEWYNTYVAPFRKQKLREKYMALIDESVYTPKWLAAKMYADENNNANVQYVFVPYTTINDSAKVTDAEIEDYLKRNSKKYWQEEESRSLEYVVFDATPTAQDSAAVYNNLVSLKEPFAQATDNSVFITKSNSRTDYFDAYLLKSKIQVPMKDTLFKLSNGQVFGPYLDANTYTLAKMVDHKPMPDSIFCRHILIKSAGDHSPADSAAKKKIDSVESVIKAGADFTAVMKAVSEDSVATNTDGGIMKFSLADVQNKKQFDQDFAKYILEAAKGERKVVKTKFGYHYIEVTEKKGIEEAYKIAYLSKEIFSSDETINNALTKANNFTAAVNNKYDAFLDNIKKNNYTKQQAENLDEHAVFSLGGEASREMVRWAYLSKKGDISDVKRMGDKFVVAALVKIKEKGMPKADDVRAMVEGKIRNERKSKEILKKIGTNNTLETIAAATGQAVSRADSLSFSRPRDGYLGGEPKVMGVIFNPANKDKVSAPIVGNSGVFVVKPEAYYALPNAAMTEEQLREAVTRQIRGGNDPQNPNGIMEVMRKSSKIKDSRTKMGY